MIDILTATLLDLMPDSLKRDPQVRALAEAISPELQEIARLIPETILLPRLDELTEPVVDLLAWQLHVDFYEPNLPIEQKRDLVRESSQWHRHKGTPWAVEQVVSIIFPGAKVAEWFEYGGQPYHFRIETEKGFTTNTDLARLVRLISTTKNLRSHLDSVTVNTMITGNLYFGGAMSEYKRTEIYPVQFEMPDLRAERTYGAVVSTVAKTTINSEVI